MTTKRLVFVGGHHTSALPVIDVLKNQTAPFTYQFFWLGHRHSMWGDTNDSLEYKDVTRLGVPFYDLKAGKLYKTYHPLKLIRVPWGFLQAAYYLLKIRPHLIVSFGGYLSVPVDIVAWILGVPIILHEQTVAVGFANGLVSHFAKKILLTWPQSLRKFPVGKAEVVGLPIRQELLEVCHSGSWRPESGNGLLDPRSESGMTPLIYIAGGKQGSHLINEAFYSILPRLLTKYRVVQQCGHNSLFDDFARLKKLKATLPAELSQNYVVSDFFAGQVVAEILQDATLVATRSGAHIVYELLAFGLPCLLIPLPESSHNEQYLNAQILVDMGLGVILAEKDLTPPSLLSTVEKMIQEAPRMVSNSREAAMDLVVYDAAQKIARAIQNCLVEQEN